MAQTKKIKIFEVASNLNMGGVGRAMQEFALNIDKSKFEVIVGAFDISGSWKEQLEENGLTVFKISEKNLPEIIEENGVDLVHSHNIHVKQFIGKTKNVHTVVFSDGFCDAAEINLIKSKTLALKLSSIKKLRYGENYYVLYNPKNVESWRKYCLSPNEIRRRRNALGIKSTDIVIGRLGRAEPAKVDYLLLNAAPLIEKELSNAKFIFLGLPKLYEFFLKRNKYLNGKIIFLPQTSDNSQIAEFYQLIDIFWHTSSRGETFGNTLVEAAIFKKPVITHSTPFKRSILPPSDLFTKVGNCEIDNAQIELVDHMKTGLVANYPEDVVEAVKFFYFNPQARKEFGERGHSKVLKFYEAKKVVKNFECIVEALISGENAKISPSKAELSEYFNSEYAMRLGNKIEAQKGCKTQKFKFQKFCYTSFLEFPYLIIRYVLRIAFGKNIEK